MKEKLMIDPANILIVDDNIEMRKTLDDILIEEGYKITGVGTLGLGKRRIRKEIL